MSVVCQCPTCQAKYQVGDQYAGRTIKCPKCSAAVVVPAAAQPTVQAGTATKSSPESPAKASSISSRAELPKGQAVGLVNDPQAKPASTGSSSMKTARAVAISAAEVAADDRETDQAPPADDGLGFLTEETIRPKRQAAPAAAKQSSGANGAGGDLASISGLAGRSAKGVAAHAKKKKKGFPPWMIPTIAGVGAVAVIVVASIVYMNSNPKPKSGTLAASSGGKNSGKARRRRYRH